MRFTKGWVKFHREIMDKPDIWEHATRYNLLARLFPMATIKETTVDFAGIPTKVPAGSIVTSLNELSKLTGSGTRKIQLALDYLEKRQTIGKQTSNQGTIITLLNFNSYQGDKSADVKQVSSDWETEDKRRINGGQLIEEYKNIRSKEYKNILMSELGSSDSQIEFQKSSPTPYQELLNLWKQHCSHLPQPKSLSRDRKNKVSIRFKAHPDLSYWEDIFKRVALSDFLSGRTNENNRTWKCDFMWLFKNNENHLKVSEGRFDNAISKQELKERELEDKYKRFKENYKHG